MWYIQQNWCAFPLFDGVKLFCHAACLCVVFIRFFFSHMGSMNECSANSHAQPVHPLSCLQLPPLYPASLPKPALSSTLPFLTAQPTIHTIISQSASTIFRMSLLVSKNKKKKKKNKCKILFQNYWLLFVA